MAKLWTVRAVGNHGYGWKAVPFTWNEAREMNVYGEDLFLVVTPTKEIAEKMAAEKYQNMIETSAAPIKLPIILLSR